MTTTTLVTKASAAALLTASACLAIASCASIQPYNPNHLGAERLSQVDEVCQSVMGFKPSESLTDNLWTGDPDSSSVTNRYRGCIATLSNSLARTAAARAGKQAEQDCLSHGYVAGGSDLARCLLTAELTQPAPTRNQLASLDPKPYLVSDGRRYSGTIPSTAEKEQVACADIGIEPTDDEFAVCVRSLKNVRLAPSLQELYTNDG